MLGTLARRIAAIDEELAEIQASTSFQSDYTFLDNGDNVPFATTVANFVGILEGEYSSSLGSAQ